jgi:hypothetical protein
MSHTPYWIYHERIATNGLLILATTIKTSNLLVSQMIYQKPPSSGSNTEMNVHVN